MTLLQLELPFEGVSLKWMIATAPPQPSVAVIDVGAGGGTCEKHVTVTGAGHEIIVGGVVSLTVIVCEQKPMLPAKSTP